MSQITTVVVEDVSERSGEKDGRKWTKYALKDGNGDWYGTFEKGVVVEAMKGNKYEIEWEQNGNFKNLLRASPVDDSPISSRTDTGEADWDLIGLRKTRCALWAAYLTEALPQAFGLWVAVQTDPPGTLDITNFISRIGRELVLTAEIDIFNREPAVKDDDVPF